MPYLRAEIQYRTWRVGRLCMMRVKEGAISGGDGDEEARQ
jgi:hypothetical protein